MRLNPLLDEQSFTLYNINLDYSRITDDDTKSMQAIITYPSRNIFSGHHINRNPHTSKDILLA